jgi:hypothetical protein
MNAVTLLRNQIAGVHGRYHDVIEAILPGEWKAQVHPRGNPVGFLAWHIPATRDWAVHVWCQGHEQLRHSSNAGKRPGINPAHPPFGMSFDDAVAVAAAATLGDVLAYADEVFAATMSYLETLTDDALDLLPDTRAANARVPYQTAGYLEEIDDMYDFPVWRTLTGPAFAHARGHVDEISAALEAIRSK